MSVQALSWVLEHSASTLGARLVLLAVANHADKYGANAWGSVATYAAEARLSERHARAALRQLESAGELEQTGRHGERRDRATIIYRLPKMASDEGRILPPVHVNGGQSSTERGAILDTDPVPTGGSPLPPNRLNRPEPSLFSSDADRLCTLLADLIEGNGSKRPTISGRWLIDAERLIRLDHRPVDEAASIIVWCQAEPFWRSVIMSMPKLREKYDVLRLKRQQIVAGSRGGRLDWMDALEASDA